MIITTGREIPGRLAGRIFTARIVFYEIPAKQAFQTGHARASMIADAADCPITADVALTVRTAQNDLETGLPCDALNRERNLKAVSVRRVQRPCLPSFLKICVNLRESADQEIPSAEVRLRRRPAGGMSHPQTGI